jgi:hypothetical protein
MADSIFLVLDLICPAGIRPPFSGGSIWVASTASENGGLVFPEHVLGLS